MMRDWPRQISLMADVLAGPAEVFRELGRSPVWSAAFVIGAVATVVLSILRIPFLGEAGLQELAPVVPEEALKETAAMRERMHFLGCAALPFGIAARWTVLSASLFLALGFAGARQLRFAPVFSVVAYSHTTLLAGDLVNTLILHIKGVNAVHSTADLECLIGAGRLLYDPTPHPFLFTLLNAVNPFEAWHVMLLAIGLSVVTEIPRGRAVFLVLAIVILSAAGSGFMITLISEGSGVR